jgi:hypothetical protein
MKKTRLSVAAMIAGVFANCAVALAQTNLDSSGYVTNAALLTPFTITVSSGKVITNAVLVKLMPNKFIYKIPGVAGGGMERLDSLPKNLQERFGYDPSKSAAADEIDRRKKMGQIEYFKHAAMVQQQQADYEQRLKTLLEERFVVEGQVIQKISEGLLVQSVPPNAGWTGLSHGTIVNFIDYTMQAKKDALNAGVQELSVYSGLILLEDHPKYRVIVDENSVAQIVYPIGEFKYTTTQGATKTIRKATCDLDKAMSFLLQQQ